MSNIETSIEGNKVIYKRYFEVPVKVAFEAWASAEQLGEWWGPDGFTLTTKNFDFSVNGIWEFTMHGPDGTDYANRIQFLEIQKPGLIRYRHLGAGDNNAGIQFETVVIFETSGNGTRLTMQQIFNNSTELERVNREFGAIEGGKQHLGNLDKHLSQMKVSNNE